MSRDTTRGIPLVLASAPSIEVEGALVAAGLGMEVAEFRERMDQGRVRVLCERGTGEDDGLFRASFYFGERRVRLVVDASGNPVGPIETR